MSPKKLMLLALSLVVLSGCTTCPSIPDWPEVPQEMLTKRPPLKPLKSQPSPQKTTQSANSEAK